MARASKENQLELFSAKALQGPPPDKIVRCIECDREIVIQHFTADSVEFGFVSVEGRCFSCCFGKW